MVFNICTTYTPCILYTLWHIWECVRARSMRAQHRLNLQCQLSAKMRKTKTAIQQFTCTQYILSIPSNIQEFHMKRNESRQFSSKNFEYQTNRNLLTINSFLLQFSTNSLCQRSWDFYFFFSRKCIVPIFRRSVLV